MESAYKVKVDRPVYDQEELNKKYHDYQPKTKWWRKVYNSLSCSPHSFFLNTFPVLKWMQSYHWKEDILSDLMSGITVAVMHIPQGLAYALLGNVPPVVGIYMAFFPVIVYFFLGTSRHVSMGTFAVVCLMTGQSVIAITSDENDRGFTLGNDSSSLLETKKYTAIEVATTITFMVGIYEVIMYFFNLGIICNLLSDMLVSGFTTAAAIHVLTSQIKDLVGLKIIRYKGPLKILYTWAELFSSIQNSNLASVVISVITIGGSVLCNEIIKPLLNKFTTFPFPSELTAIIIGTVVSRFASLQDTYNISVVGHIPTGLPSPKIPPLSLISEVAADSFVISIVSYTITMSMAILFASKLNYEVNSNQELLAQGSGNIVGSFFSCMPFTASLSRSLIQQATGGKSQFASIFSCCILLFVLLWIGPFFEDLPRCVLASIIVVALKGMLQQVRNLPKYWKLSTTDGIIWLSTFIAAVFVDIDIGLLVGVIVSVSVVFIQDIKPYICLLGVVPETDIYLDTYKYKGVSEVSGIKIIHYSGTLNYITRDNFKVHVHNMVEKCVNNISLEQDANKVPQQREMNIIYLILDFSALTYIDPSGVNTLKILQEKYNQLGISFIITGSSKS